MRTIALLTLSNIFMTFAWYGHLKYKSSPLWIAIMVSWLIAFVEYCFQVPANRIGHSYFSVVQLKTIQEVITLIVFCVFSVLYMEPRGHSPRYLTCRRNLPKQLVIPIRPAVGGTSGIRPTHSSTGRARGVLRRRMKEAIRWNHAVGFAFIIAAVFFIFKEF